VTGDQEVLPLTPGKDIGACTGKVEAMKLFRPVGFVDLPADVAVAVLLSIKVLKRLLVRKHLQGVLSVHEHEYMSPHEDVVVEPCGNIVGNKSAYLLGFPKVVESNLPGFPIAIGVWLMIATNRLRKMLFGVLKRGEGCRRIL